MTTPASNSTYGIIGQAMLEAKLIQHGDEPDSEYLALNMNRLNRMALTWQTQGLKLWLQVDTAVTLTAGKGGQGNPYTFTPSGDVNITRPLRVLQGYYLASDGTTRRPIYPLSWEEWLRLSAVNQTGAISQYFVNKRATEIDVYFWLIPDATAAAGVAHLLLQTQAAASTNLTDTMTFPPEWELALLWGLADEICTGQPAAIVQRCAQKALFYKTLLEDWDVEDAPTQFAPDMRANNYGQSNFA